MVVYILTFLCIDADEIDTFSVDKSTGKVKLVKPLDSNFRNHYRLLVKSEDDSDPPKFDTAEVSESQDDWLIKNADRFNLGEHNRRHWARCPIVSTAAVRSVSERESINSYIVD